MIEILLIANIVITIIFGIILFKKKIEVKTPFEQRIIKEFKTDPLIDDIMEYTMQNEIMCTVRPGQNDTQTLFYHDEQTRSEYKITELFSVDAPRGSAPYTKTFNELKKRIDFFIENKTEIIKEIKERVNK
jgi:hypothetical protein